MTQPARQPRGRLQPADRTVVGHERASALSALNSTDPLLAEVMAIAGLGSLHLTAGLTWF
jgi:hypothetical protein